MIVQLKTSLVWYGKPYHDGEEIDLPNDVAAKFVASRQADPVNTPAEVETAMIQQSPQRGNKYERSKTTGRAT